MSGRRRRLLAAAPLLAAALAVVAALPALRGEFVYDDYPYLVDNADLRGGLDRVPRLFVSALPSHAPERGLYRPLTVLSWRLDRVGGPVDPVRHRATNLGLAFLLVLAAHAALRRVVPAAAALAGAFLFAVHPVHTEAVAWVTGRSEILAATFACLAFAGAVDATRSGSRARAALAGLALLAGTLAKENALVAVPLALLWIARERPRPRRGAVGAIVALALASGIALVLRSSALGAFAPAVGERVGGATLFARLPLVLAALGEHLRLLAWPHPLLVERMPRAPSAWTDPTVLAGAAVVLAWIASLVVLRRRRPAAFLLAWPIVALLPVLHLVPIGATVAERFLLLPSVGFAGAVGLALTAPGRWLRGRRVVLAVAVLGGLVVAAQYARVWRFEEDLWRHALRYQPGSPRAWSALGDSYARRDWPDKAEENFRRALEIEPGLTTARLALAQALDDQGRPDLALEESRAAVRQDPDHAVALNNLGARLARAGQLGEAAPLFRRAVERAPGYAPALRNAALAAAQQGRAQEARELWERARSVDPGLPPASAVLPEPFPGPSAAP